MNRCRYMPPIGATVKVIADPKVSAKRYARVAGYYPDIDGGLYLDRYVMGFRSWNYRDLARVPARLAHLAREKK